MTRKPTLDILGDPTVTEADIVSATFNGAPVILPDLKWTGYSDLSSEARVIVQQRTGEIKRLMRKTAQGVIDIGAYLIDVKACLDYGQFGDWLEAEFAWKERAARHFMAVAEQFKTANFADLSIAPSALYLLASPSTPEPARAEVIERAQAGEKITYSAAKETVQQYRPPAPTGPAPQALTAVKTWLLANVPTSQRTYALRNYKTPPWSNTLKQHIGGIAPEQVRAAVSFMIANPDAVSEQPVQPEPSAPVAPQHTPAPARSGNGNGSRAQTYSPGDSTPRPAVARFAVLDETEAGSLANVVEGQCVDAVSVDETGRLLLGLRNGFAIHIAAVTEAGRPALAWRIVS